MLMSSRKMIRSSWMRQLVWGCAFRASAEGLHDQVGDRDVAARRQVEAVLQRQGRAHVDRDRHVKMRDGLFAPRHAARDGLPNPGERDDPAPQGRPRHPSFLHVNQQVLFGDPALGPAALNLGNVDALIGGEFAGPTGRLGPVTLLRSCFQSLADGGHVDTRPRFFLPGEQRVHLRLFPRRTDDADGREDRHPFAFPGDDF